MYEKNNGNSMSYDALLSQAGIPSDEAVDLPHDDESQQSPEEKKAEALKSAKALADLPGMPGFLKPTRTMAATDDARAKEDQRSKNASEGSSATTTATDANGQGFKVTVMVSPDGETSAEATALRDGATSSKPAPVTFSSPYGAPGADPRYYPPNQAGTSNFGPMGHPSLSFDGAPNSMPLPGAPMPDPYGFTPNPSIPLDTHNSVSFAPNNSMSFGSDPAMGGMGAVTYDTNGSMNPSFPLTANGFGAAGQSQPGLPGDPFGMPLAEDVAAAQMAAAQAAQNAAMVDMMAAYGPDAVSDEAKKRFLGKKKREKAAQKAAEEAAAYAAATAAAAAEAAAAEEIARHQPTAYIPTTPPSQFGGTPTSPSGSFGDQQMTGIIGGMGVGAAMGAVGAMGAMGPMGAGAPGMAQPGMAIRPVADTSGFDQLTSTLPNMGGYQNGMMSDPSATTGMPPVQQIGGGMYGTNAMGMSTAYDQYGYGGDGSGMTPEGVAALEAMRTEMNDASASHNKRVRTIKIIIASVVGLIAAAAITFGVLVATNVISLDALGIHIESGVHEDGGSGANGSSASGLSYYSSSSSSSASSSSAASSASSASESAGGGGTTGDNGSSGGTPSGAGDEIYHYTLTTIDGEKPAVTEVVSYDENGLCLQTAMDAVFSSATAAQAFVERVRSDYGSNFLSGSVDGTTAHVVVNMARSKLTREGYENALRNVVDGLEIERLT